MKSVKIIILLIFSTSVQITAQSYSLNHQGYQREYILHLPAGWNHKEQISLLICLHGGGGNAEQMQKFSGFNTLADQRIFIVVYPNGWKGHWNDQRGGCTDEAHNLNIDDVGFISALIDTLKIKHPINKVYVTGISNGGMMSYKLGSTIGNKLSGIAPIAACMPENLYKASPATLPMKVLIMNGTADPLVPYNGGEVKVGKYTRGRVASTEQSKQYWLKINQCDSTKHTHYNFADKDKTDDCTAYSEEYSSCGSEQKITVITIINGGHNIPGNKQYLPKSMIGNTCNDFNGEEMITEFFEL
jgi:polyhydroxybutyrate depolymerase